MILFAYLAVIVYASLTPPKNIPRLIYIPYIDKVVHFLMYLGFCLIAPWAMDERIYKKGHPLTDNIHLSRIIPIVLVLAVSWGVVMELFQRTMNIGRHYSIYDLIANMAGACVGTVLYYLLFGRKKTGT